MSARALLALVLVVGCAADPAPAPERPRAARADVILEAVARVHGGAGPFAVAGHRMGERALTDLGLRRGEFAIEVEHTCPRQVQWSCIADGLQAATGASPGKLNLSLTFVDDGQPTESRVRDRRSGRVVVMGLKDEFLAAFLDTPMDRLREAGARVAVMSDDEIFWVRSEQGGQ